MQGNSHTKKHCSNVSKGLKIWIQIVFSLLNNTGLQRLAKGYACKAVTEPGNLSTIFLEISLELHRDSSGVLFKLALLLLIHLSRRFCLSTQLEGVFLRGKNYAYTYTLPTLSYLLGPQ